VTFPRFLTKKFSKNIGWPLGSNPDVIPSGFLKNYAEGRLTVVHDQKLMAGVRVVG